MPFGLGVAPAEWTRFMNFFMIAVKNINRDLFYSGKLNCEGLDVDKNIFRKEFEVIDDEMGNIIIPLIDAYVDDIYGIQTSETKAKIQFELLQKLSKAVGIKLKEEKSNKPNWWGVLLGVIHDTLLEVSKAEPQKVERYLKHIDNEKRKKKIQGEELISIVGQVRHVGGIYRGVNGYARNLESIIYTKPLHNYHRNTKRLTADMELCKYGLKKARDDGVKWKNFLRPANKGDIVVYGDAALETGGIGGVITTGREDGEYIQQDWSDIQLHNSDRRDIVWRELIVPYVWLRILQQKEKRDVSITIYSDNEGVVWMLRKRGATLRRPDCQKVLEKICQMEIDMGWHLWSEHIKGKDNDPSDALSRNDWKRAHASYKLKRRLKVKTIVQDIANICKGIVPKKKYLVMEDEE